MIRFLADENFPARAVGTLRQAGVRVESVLEIAPGEADEMVLARALETGAAILTFDKDFGELAWRSRPTPGFGVVLFRTPMPKAAEAGVALARIVQSRTDWEGHFSVIEPGRLRMRALGSS
jgi:predicted nuclease of predicted toxin-antitoxin system